MSITSNTNELELQDKNDSWKRERFNKTTSNMSKDVRDALNDMIFNQFYIETIHSDNNNATICIESNAGYDRTVTFIDAFGVPDKTYHELDFIDISFNQSNDLYVLTGETYNWDDDVCTPFAIRFKDIQVDISVYNATNELYASTPWDKLTSIAWTILDKSILCEECINEKEKNLLPLIAELCTLTYWGKVPDTYNTSTLPLLKDYALRYNYKKVLELLGRYKLVLEDSDKRLKLHLSLFNELNLQKYEPLWRELYSLLAQSQADYPNKAEVLCPRELLLHTRAQIQAYMEEHGYTGTYPDFIKSSRIKGIHLAENYKQSYFVGLNQHTLHHIHCTEDYINEQLHIEFLCGTQILGKNDNPCDIYGCIFNANGHRFVKTVNYIDSKDSSNTLDDYMTIATKRAEFQKLTKEEQYILFGGSSNSLSLFLLMFTFLGGVFGIIMTIAFMAMAILSALLVGQPEVIPSMITEIPWWICLVFCWIGFGGIMGIITVLVKRK